LTLTVYAEDRQADRLVCPCGGRLRIVSFITDPRVVDRHD